MNPFILPVTLLVVAALIFAVTERDKLHALWMKIQQRRNLYSNQTDHPAGQDQMAFDFEAIFGFSPEELRMPHRQRQAVAHALTYFKKDIYEYTRMIELLRYWNAEVDWSKLILEVARDIDKQLRRETLTATTPPERGLDFITFPSNPNDE
jgi:hypothetical protein